MTSSHRRYFISSYLLGPHLYCQPKLIRAAIPWSLPAFPGTNAPKDHGDGCGIFMQHVRAVIRSHSLKGKGHRPSYKSHCKKNIWNSDIVVLIIGNSIHSSTGLTTYPTLQRHHIDQLLNHIVNNISPICFLLNIYCTLYTPRKDKVGRGSLYCSNESHTK